MKLRLQPWKNRLTPSGILQAALSQEAQGPFNPRLLITYSYLIVSALGILVTSYLGISYSESISSKVVDDWCDPNSEGVGKHCFSDFYSVVEIKHFSEPWSRGSTYPPLAILISKLFSTLGTENSRIGLIAYLSVGLMALIIPVIHLKKARIIKKVRNVLTVGITVICAGPSLMALDRGNNVLFLFPVVYFIYVYACQNKFGKVSALIVVGALIKPQMIVLFIVPMLNQKIRPVLIGTSIYLFTNTLLFCFFPGNYLQNIGTWVGNLQGYQTYPGMPSLGNYSFANAIGLIFGFTKVLTQGATVGEVFRPGLTSTTVSILSVAYLIVVTTMLALRRAALDPKIQLLIGSSLIILVPGTSFGYYLIFLLVPLLFMEVSNDNTGQDFAPKREREEFLFRINRITRISLSILFLLVIPPWPFQWGMLNLGVNEVWDHYGIMPTFVGAILWLLPLILLTNSKQKSSPSRLESTESS